VSTFRFPPIVFVIFCFAGSFYGQEWSGILDPSRAVDWSQAGVVGGIPTNRTQCVTSQCNTVSGGSVTAASISAALASAPANTYVLVPAGTFAMSTGIEFPAGGSKSPSCTSKCSNVTLRGSGSNSTFLVFSGGGGAGICGVVDICASSADVNYSGGPSNTATLGGTNGVSGTYTKGATSIILSSKSNLAVGSQIILDQLDDQRDNGGLYVGCEYPDGSAACYSGTWPGGYSRGTNLATARGQQQVVNVTSISGSGPYTIGITPGIYASNWQSSHSPGAWWATSPIQGDAVENISLDHTNGGAGVNFWDCTGCWVKGIRSIRTSNTGTGWYHVGFNICNHCEARDSYLYGATGTSVDTYGAAVYIGSDIRQENMIAQFPGTSTFYSSDCEGCVSGYNFGLNAYYPSSNAWLAQNTEYHAIVTLSLQEGNIGTGLYADSFHGTHVLNTQFRNRWDGREPNNGNATSSSTVAIRLNPGARFDNAIGNVLGTPGYHTNYKATPSGGNLYTSSIGTGVYPEVGTTDSLVATTAMFWGNWDTATAAVRWNASEVPTGLSSYSNAVPSSQTLPASFYYSSKPSWWPSGKAWPPIGPDVRGGNVGQCSGGTYNSSEAFANSQCTGGTLTAIAGGMVVSIPAMDCYFSVMGGVANGTGKPLAFDSNACYSYSSNVDPPSGLTAVVD
jgi:hypothetical protein